MQFGVLGPLLVQESRGPVTLASAKQRALLAILLLETPHVVPVERLVDELWGDQPAADGGARHSRSTSLSSAGPSAPTSRS